TIIQIVGEGLGISDRSGKALVKLLGQRATDREIMATVAIAQHNRVERLSSGGRSLSLIVQRIDKARAVAAGIYVAIIGISGNTQSRRVHQVRILENGGADIAVIDRFEGKDGSPSQFGIEAQARLPG